MIKLREVKTIEKYYVVLYTDRTCTQILNNILTNSFDDALEFIDDNLTYGCYVILKNMITNNSLAKSYDDIVLECRFYDKRDLPDKMFDILWDIFYVVE